MMTTIDCIDKRLTNDRPDLSSERALPTEKNSNFEKKFVW
jgi:hypothetical protein